MLWGGGGGGGILKALLAAPILVLCLIWEFNYIMCHFHSGYGKQILWQTV